MIFIMNMARTSINPSSAARSMEIPPEIADGAKRKEVVHPFSFPVCCCALSPPVVFLFLVISYIGTFLHCLSILPAAIRSSGRLLKTVLRIRIQKLFLSRKIGL